MFFALISAIITITALEVNGFSSGLRINHRLWKVKLSKIFVDLNNVTTTTHKLTLSDRLANESTTFHWFPYKRILVKQLTDGVEEEECWDRPRAIEEFPKGFWSRKS